MLAILIMPMLLMVAVLGASSYRKVEARAESTSRTEVETRVIADLTSLRYDVSHSLMSRRLRAISANLNDLGRDGVGESERNERYAGALGRLADSRATVERLAGSTVVDDLAIIGSRYGVWDAIGEPSTSSTVFAAQAAVSDPSDEEMAAIMADLDRGIDRAQMAAGADTLAVVEPIIEISRIQTALVDEAELILSLLFEAPQPGDTSFGPDFVARLEKATAIEETALERLHLMLTPANYQTLVAGLQPAAFAGLREKVYDVIDEGDLNDFVVYLGSHIDELTSRYWEIGSVRNQLVEAIIAEADARNELARFEERQAMLAMLAVAVLGVLLMVTVARSLSMRVTAMTDRAEQISRGWVSDEVIEEGGPVEFGVLAGAFNKMTNQLSVVEQKIAAIADGAFDDPVLGTAIPGPLGADLQRSVERVVSTTAELSAAEAMTSAIVDSAADAIFTIDEDGYVTSANAASQSLTSQSQDAVIGHRLADMLTGLPDPFTASQQAGSTEFVLDRFDGSVIHALVSVRALGGRDQAYTMYVRDISERAEWEERFRQIATVDEVTGLANRLGFDESLRDFDAPCGVLVVDLERYRFVVNVWGHSCADRIVAEVADRIVGEVPVGSLVARTATSEFTVVIPGRTGPSLDRFAGGLRLALGAPIELDENEIRLDSSVGLADLLPGEDPADVVRFAELALARAKELGRSEVVRFRSSFVKEVESEALVEQRLRVAIESGALEMHAQPIVSIETECVTGFELLARWRDEGEWISPEVFIPLAERGGLIPALGRWAMAEAVSFLNQLHDAGFALSVSCNVSGLHLMSGTLVGELAALIGPVEWDRSLLHLEVTESVLVDDDLAIRLLASVRALGARVWLDDFGTGFSSLTYLNRLPIDGLKLDRSFVNPDVPNARTEELVRIVGDLARTFQLDAIAEGVETPEQRQMVRERGFGSGQGWLWHRAKPIGQWWPILEYERRHGRAAPDADGTSTDALFAHWPRGA